MKIITINLPLKYIEIIESLVGDRKLYPSRSELIRVAVRDFLIKELNDLKRINSFNPKKEEIIEAPISEVDSNLFVQIPIGDSIDGITEYKTFRLVKK